MIKKIKWNDNHPILKSLELDFLKGDGTPYNTIVLAGENGTGKTTILETLTTFLGRKSFDPFEYIQYTLNGKTYTLSRSTDSDAVFGFHKRTNNSDNTVKDIRSNYNNNANKIDTDKEDIRYYGVAYSKARSGFKTNSIKTTTTQELDSDKYQIDDKEDYTLLKQLIIDIDTSDNRQLKKIAKKGFVNANEYNEFSNKSKLSRFTNAFNNFFDTIKFDDIKTDSNEIKIIFTKYDKSITIDQLSTGEKQIVFRGTYLLKNKDNISGGTILVDEPELSMHPKWQEKILKYYRDLFTENGNQKVQIIFATHSETVLRAAINDKDNVLVIVLKDDNGMINAMPITAPVILPSITSAELNYMAFDIASNDYHIELYSHLQNITGKNNVKECDDYIAAQPIYDVARHEKKETRERDHNKTLPTYIRNAIDHPNSSRTFSQNELKCSIELLIELCKSAT